MPSTPPPEHPPASSSSSFLAHFSRSPPAASSSSSSPSAAPSSSTTTATRPHTRASAQKRARSASTSTTGIPDPNLVGPPPRVPLPPSAIHPPSTQDTRDRKNAYSHVPPGAQLMDPTGLTRIQSKPRRKIGTFEAWRIWYSSLTVGSMFEQWEVIFVHSVVLGLFILLGCALAYFPPHLAHVLERWRYYLSGSSELA